MIALAVILLWLLISTLTAVVAPLDVPGRLAVILGMLFLGIFAVLFSLFPLLKLFALVVQHRTEPNYRDFSSEGRPLPAVLLGPNLLEFEMETRRLLFAIFAFPWLLACVCSAIAAPFNTLGRLLAALFLLYAGLYLVPYSFFMLLSCATWMKRLLRYRHQTRRQKRVETIVQAQDVPTDSEQSFAIQEHQMESEAP